MEELIRNLYAKYAPDVNVDEKVEAISKTDYGVGEFIDDFYAKYAPEENTEEKKDAIYSNYFPKQYNEALKKQEKPGVVEVNTWLENLFGQEENVEYTLFDKDKNYGEDPGKIDFVKNLIQTGVEVASDMGRAFSGGIVPGEALPAYLDLFDKKNQLSSEEAKKLIEVGKKLEEAPQTKDMAEFSKRFGELTEEHGNVKGAFKAWGENPSAMLQFWSQSTALMGSSLYYSGEAKTAALTTGTTLAGGTSIATAGPDPSDLITAPIAFVSGAMGGLSRTMEKGFTAFDLIIDQIGREEYGNMSDEEKELALQNVVNDKEKFNDIKSKAIARGNTIGFIDGVTGLLTGGIGSSIGRKVALSSLSKGAAVARTLGVGGVETSMGMVSEYLGQKAAGQDYNFEEIFVEGFADKTFTTLEAAKSIRKSPKYKINGQSLNGKQFKEALEIMDDEAYVSADIEVQNSPGAQQIVDNRIENINLDQKINSKISDSSDRTEMIKLEKQAKNLANNDTESGKIQLAKIKEKINAIEEKYKDSNVDATVEARKKAVADAVDNKFEKKFNKNLKSVQDFADQKGLNIDVSEKENVYFQKIADATDQTIEQVKEKAIGSDGVFIGKGKIFINKTQAKKVGAVNVASHEVLHPILNALVGGTKSQKNLVNGFKKKLNSKQRKMMDKFMGTQPEGTEYLNVFTDNFDAIMAEQNITQKISDFFRNMYVKLGYENINFDNGEGIYNFLKEYSKSTKEGKLSDRATQAIDKAEAKSDTKIGDVESVGKMQKSQVYQSVENMKSGLLNPKTKRDTAFTMSNELLNEIDRRLKIDVDAETREDIVRNFAFNEKRGLLGLIQGYDPNINDSVMGYLNAKVRGRSLFDARLQEFYEKDPRYNKIIQSLSDEATQKKVEKKADKQVKEDQGPEARALTSFNELVIDNEKFVTSEMYNTIKNKVLNNITLLLSKNKINTNDLINIIEKEIFKIVKQAQGAISKSDNKVVISKQYTNFVRDSYDVGVKALSIKTIKKSYLNKLFPSKKIGREQTAVGKDIFSISKPSISSWVKFFTQGANTTLLAKQKKFGVEITKELTLKAVREILTDQNVLDNLIQKSKLRNDELTSEIVKNYLKAVTVTLDTKADEAALFDELQFSKTEQTVKDVLNSEDADVALADVEDPALRQWIYETFLVPGITSENIAYIGEALNKIDQKTFQRIGSIRSKVAGKTVVNKDVLEIMEEGLDKYVKGIPAQLIKVIGIDFAGLHYRGINWNSKKRDAYISKLKDFEETDEAKKLYDKINIEHLNKQVQGEKQYKEIVLKSMAEPNVEKAKQIISDARADILLTNEANSALLNYLTFKAQQLNLDPGYIFEVGQMQTNIQNGTRAYSQLGHTYITEGQQIAVNKNGNILAKPKNKAGLKAYYTAWSKTSLWDEAVKIAKQEKAKDIKKRAVQLLTPKNEHLGASALSNAAAAAGVISKSITADNVSAIWQDHITLWAPLMIANMIDKAGGKVNRSGVRRIMLLPKNHRANIFNLTEGKPSENVIIQQETETMQFSKSNSEMFNDIIEQTKGVESVKRFSDAAAKSRGAKKGLFDFFVPPSAEDFVGLLYKFLDKGKIGEQQFEFFKEKLTKPFAAAMAEIDRRKQRMSNEYLALRKQMPGVKKILNENTGYNEFTFDSAVRVYLWTKAGFKIDGLSKRDQTELIKKVKENADLKLYADKLSKISRLKEGWVKPGENWLAGNIPSDISDINQKTNRKELLSEWIKNKNEIFNKENLNKIEAIYGTDFREALVEILDRMERGSNRPIGTGQNKLTTKFMNWVNNSVGAIMFFNARSSILQTISMANFVNFTDNNIFAAAAAFANQKQFWADFTMLFNSDFLQQRRSGLKTDINEAEISNAVGTAQNKATAAFKYMLKKGFLPTQIADSFAIAMGGASFVRNRVNTLIKNGMTKEDAMKQAMIDFREIAEEAQQSSRPDRISSQQAGPLGRVILAFANTPMQYVRLQKKAYLDLINKRGDWKSNVSKILYYGAIQNFIFNALQQALFAMAFDDDEEKLDEKQIGIINGMLDSQLRGLGVAGAGVSTVKNMVMELIRQNQKSRPDYVNVAIKSTTISPPISSKLSKLISAARTFQWNGKKIKEEGLSLDNPANLAIGKTVSAFTNIPLDRLIQKVDNLKTATEEETETWQKIALTLGWDQWSLGLSDYKKKKPKMQTFIPIIRRKNSKKRKKTLTIN